MRCGIRHAANLVFRLGEVMQGFGRIDTVTQAPYPNLRSLGKIGFGPLELLQFHVQHAETGQRLCQCELVRAPHLDLAYFQCALECIAGFVVAHLHPVEITERFPDAGDRS